MIGPEKKISHVFPKRKHTHIFFFGALGLGQFFLGPTAAPNAADLGVD